MSVFILKRKLNLSQTHLTLLPHLILKPEIFYLIKFRKMKLSLLPPYLIACSLALFFPSGAIADPGKGNNEKTTGIATDKTPGNPNSNDNATNNPNAKPKGANDQGVINSSPKALPLKKSPVGVPIDGGAGALLVAGAAYGVKRIRDYRKKNRRTPSAA